MLHALADLLGVRLLVGDVADARLDVVKSAEHIQRVLAFDGGANHSQNLLGHVVNAGVAGYGGRAYVGVVGGHSWVPFGAVVAAGTPRRGVV